MDRSAFFKKLKFLRGFAIPLVIVGLFFVWFGFSEQIDAVKLARICRVTSYQKKYNKTTNEYYYDPVLTFTAEDGTVRQAVFSGTTSIPVMGQEMQVFYDPASDLAVSYRKLHPDEDALFVFKLFGGIVSGAGLLLLIVSLLQRDKQPNADHKTE